MDPPRDRIEIKDGQFGLQVFVQFLEKSGKDFPAHKSTTACIMNPGQHHI